MKSFRFKKIDAFATKDSGGNPAGYIHLDKDQSITEQEMLQIAVELKGFVNEVGFVFENKNKKIKLKYYSSEKEVEFCGHATIGIMYDLIINNEFLLNSKQTTIETNFGKLEVENKIKDENSVFITAPSPKYIKTTPSIKDIEKNLKIGENVINKDLPIKIINAGLNTLIVPINTLDNILDINPDINILKDFCINNNLDIIEVFTSDVYNKNSNYRTRVFAPTFGYLEDPATGSGNSALGYYLIQNNMWKEGIITIEQNGYKDNYNIVKLKKIKDKNGNEIILFGGGAITRIEGEYFLQK